MLCYILDLQYCIIIQVYVDLQTLILERVRKSYNVKKKFIYHN